MSTELETLARRAVACKHWRWMPGMSAIMTKPHDGETTFRVVDYIGNRETGAPITMYPDFSDSPTVGALFYLVRAAWGPTVYLIAQGGWLVQGARLPDGSTINLGICRPTEVEALVAALEAAP